MDLKIPLIRRKKRVFADYASATPMRSEVFSAMKPYLRAKFVNPSSIYEEGVFAKRILSDSRKEIAGILGASADEIIFTGSGTESDNLAIFGVLRSAKKSLNSKAHAITTKIEHPAVLETLKEAEKSGLAEVTYLLVGEDGRVDLKSLKEALRPETVLVSISYANGEIGTIERISEVAKILKTYRREHSSVFPYLHSDASQAVNYLSVNVLKLGVDLMTLDASKIYGPKGVGLLYVKKGIQIESIIFGGGQERGLRSGTENIAGIVGFAKALSFAEKERESEFERLLPIRDYFIKEVLEKFPDSYLNGSLENRLPNNINICFPSLNAEFAVIKLDSLGVCASFGSACGNLSDDASSYVVEALGKKECGISSLRFTFGRETTKKDIDFVLGALAKTICTQIVRPNIL